MKHGSEAAWDSAVELVHRKMQAAERERVGEVLRDCSSDRVVLEVERLQRAHQADLRGQCRDEIVVQITFRTGQTKFKSCKLTAVQRRRVCQALLGYSSIHSCSNGWIL
jgi:hypothetical protein